MRPRKVPLRKCIACQNMIPKKSLIRIVRTPEGEVKVDATGKLSGRGAYICANQTCLSESIEKKALHRAFKARVGEEVYQQLQNQIMGRGDTGHEINPQT